MLFCVVIARRTYVRHVYDVCASVSPTVPYTLREKIQACRAAFPLQRSERSRAASMYNIMNLCIPQAINVFFFFSYLFVCLERRYVDRISVVSATHLFSPQHPIRSKLVYHSRYYSFCLTYICIYILLE